jgi:DNA (cytosine-5)-methyltransferase 1
VNLVLSLFPGIGLLDMAFEAEGFCVVRGPDPLWGGGVRNFSPPTGRFDGVIGGPPCQQFSRLRTLVHATGGTVAENLIPEFERVVHEAQPTWFLMENVPDAPLPNVNDYHIQNQILSNRQDCGGEQERVRRFSFGWRINVGPVPLFAVDWWAPPVPTMYQRTVLAKGVAVDPTKRTRSGKRRIADVRSKKAFEIAVRAQGLPEGFDLPPFTIDGKIKVVGNGVPLMMGQTIARAVRRAINWPAVENGATT